MKASPDERGNDQSPCNTVTCSFLRRPAGFNCLHRPSSAVSFIYPPPPPLPTPKKKKGKKKKKRKKTPHPIKLSTHTNTNLHSIQCSFRPVSSKQYKKKRQKRLFIRRRTYPKMFHSYNPVRCACVRECVRVCVRACVCVFLIKTAWTPPSWVVPVIVPRGR